MRFTDNFTPAASAVVKDVYYNANTHKLYVNLGGSYYAYLDVLYPVFNAFRLASSAGQFYAYSIKSKYISEFIGPVHDWEWEKDIVRSDNASGQSGLTVKEEKPKPTAPVGNSSEIRDVEYNYEVGFYTEDAYGKANPEDVRSYKVKATSVNDAIGKLNEISDMLKLTFHVKKVTVYFE